MYVDWKTTPVTHTDHERVKLRIKGYEKLILKEIENTKDREYFNRVFTAYRSQGRSQDLGEGYLEICMSQSDMPYVHGEAMRFARGIRGHVSPRKFFKMVQFGAFLVYIWIKFRKVPFFIYFWKNYHFLYKKLPFFYIKNKYFRYTLAMG